MAILNLKTTSGVDSVKKSIDKDSENIALDILQRGIYAYPEKSTVRELASNAYDAILERDIAKGILNGELKVEDHFDMTEREDGAFNASGWDPNYFDPHWLSDDPYIYINYEEGKINDTLRIKDHGVGLGEERLIGYFQLAFSTKRQSKSALGRWGLGNKSPLSLGIDSFTVINTYNGRRFKFEVYLADVQSATPKFSNGKRNESIMLTIPQKQEDGSMVDKDFEFYFEETDQKNSLEIIVPLKKHMKDKILQAVREQLMYIPNVKFYIQELGQLYPQEENINPKVLFRDKSIIISESKVLDRPHILLGVGDGLINYGVVDFDALELEPKKGSVGLILDVNEVEVTPSRESVVWSPKTRKAVIKKYNEIVETATRLINKQLAQATDYLDWIMKTTTVRAALFNNTSSSSTKTIIGELSSIIDPEEIDNLVYESKFFRVKYVPKVNVLFGSNYINIRKVLINPSNNHIDRVNAGAHVLQDGELIYYTTGKANMYKDLYIQDTLGVDSFVLINIESADMSGHKLKTILASPLISDYDEIKVPDDKMALYASRAASVTTEGDSEEDDEDVLTPWQRELMRRMNNEIVVHKFNQMRDMVFSVYTMKANSLLTYNKVVYTNVANREELTELIKILPYPIVSVDTPTRSNKEHFFTGDNMPENSYLAEYDRFNNIILKEDPKLERTMFMMVNKTNLDKLAELENAVSVDDFVIKSYRNGKLEFNDFMKTILTFRAYILKFKSMNAFNWDTTPSAVKKMLRYIENAYEPVNYSDNEKDLPIAMKFLLPWIFVSMIAEVYRSTVTSYYVYEPSLYDTLAACQIAQIEGDDIRHDALLHDINVKLPSIYCDKVDEITELDIIDMDLYNFFESIGDLADDATPILQVIDRLSIDYVSYPLHYITPILKLFEENGRLKTPKIPAVFNVRGDLHELYYGQSAEELQVGQGDQGDDQRVSDDGESEAA